MGFCSNKIFVLYLLTNFFFQVIERCFGYLYVNFVANVKHTLKISYEVSETLIGNNIICTICFSISKKRLNP